MSASLLIAAFTAAAMIFSVLFKPYVSVGKVKVGLYVAVCFLGALAELIFGGLSLSAAAEGITADSAVNPLKILALFIAMTLISIYLGDSGFFRLVAEKVFAYGNKGGQLRLYIIMYITVSALTAFTSNDIVVLTFTPIICIFCKKAGYAPLPFLIGEFVAANTFSMILIVGNPTNVYLAQSAGIAFGEYFKTMALPALVAGGGALAVLLLVFGRSLFVKPILTEPLNSHIGASQKVGSNINAPCMAASLTALIACIISLAVSDVIGVEMWALTVIFAAALTVFHVGYGFFSHKGLKIAASGIKKAPWELAPFIVSMFVIVLALEKSGVTSDLAAALVGGERSDGVTFGFMTAGLSNVFNNIPTSVITEKIIAGNSLYATYGAVIGTNIGAFITPVGALAGIMWNKILSEYGIKLPFYKFAFYGTAVAAVSLTLSAVTLIAVI